MVLPITGAESYVCESSKSMKGGELSPLGRGFMVPYTVPLPFAVGAYITAAYWFTASLSFANPAVTIARSLSDTFAGIRPSDAPLFIVAQIAGALAATFLFRWLTPNSQLNADEVLMRHLS